MTTHPAIDWQHSQSAEWITEPEGQLSVDVVETPHQIIVRSAIAGVSGDDLDITLTHDTLTIRGRRHHEQEYRHGTTHLQECYWGAFSRSIVLPCSVNSEETDAVLQSGILTVILKKTESEAHVPILDLEEL